MFNAHSRNLRFDCPEALEEWMNEKRSLAAHALRRAEATDDAELAADLRGAAASLLYDVALGVVASAAVLAQRAVVAPQVDRGVLAVSIPNEED